MLPAFQKLHEKFIVCLVFWLFMLTRSQKAQTTGLKGTFSTGPYNMYLMIETFRVCLALLFATCFCCEKSQINTNQTTRKPNLLSQKYRLSRSIFFTALETMLLSAMASNSCSKLPLATSYEEQAYLFDLFFFPVISPPPQYLASSQPTIILALINVMRLGGCFCDFPSRSSNTTMGCCEPEISEFRTQPALLTEFDTQFVSFSTFITVHANCFILAVSHPFSPISLFSLFLLFLLLAGDER